MQRARLTRVQMAKASAVKAFINTKRKTQQILSALQNEDASGVQLKNEDLFQLQHHHMLTCLEKTTVQHTPERRSIKELFIEYVHVAGPMHCDPIRHKPFLFCQNYCQNKAIKRVGFYWLIVYFFTSL